MTPKEFEAKVRAAGPWQFNPAGRIRNHRDCCPLAALVGEELRVATEGAGYRSVVVSTVRAAKELAIPRIAAEHIADGADRKHSPYRAKLEVLCGLP